jgi:hypothetical protein
LLQWGSQGGRARGVTAAVAALPFLLSCASDLPRGLSPCHALSPKRAQKSLQFFFVFCRSTVFCSPLITMLRRVFVFRARVRVKPSFFSSHFRFRLALKRQGLLDATPHLGMV